ncbi:MAG: polysaccharide ABC transporter ATP-binding protein [Bacillota bacterium]
MSETIIRFNNVQKEYRLGAIGGSTLREELQSWWAAVRKKEDPNVKIGQTSKRGSREKFMALKGVSFDVQKGERVGIIGGNGAGKSTLLKLLSRVTAPTDGEILMNGRVSSMLEVGTGFNGELTGRENIYMNGAILGMTKDEIAAKIDDIIEFSECAKFIDTPVKRYSSGMYVKLAFAVAAHLDSDILVMDEVLAVGDIRFQEKCLGKMNNLSQEDSRTVLYVSHNMATIRQLCTRCVVLKQGELIFDGDVEEAIEAYSEKSLSSEINYDYVNVIRKIGTCTGDFRFQNLSFADKKNIFKVGEDIRLSIKGVVNKSVSNIFLRFEIKSVSGARVGTVLTSSSFSGAVGDKIKLDVNLSGLSLQNGYYSVILVAFEWHEYGRVFSVDHIYDAFSFTIINEKPDIMWTNVAWGNVRFNDCVMKQMQL